MVGAAVLVGWSVLLTALAALGLHRLTLAAASLRADPPRRLRDDEPVVTVQIPLFNEANVAARCLRAAGGLDWPRDKLELQVLDDSTDDTRRIVDEAVADLVGAGIDAVVLRRDTRDGFKAGALGAGCAVARGEVIAVLDADFVAPPELLRRLVPPLVPGVACTQARWGHLNLADTWLTRTQATLLDAHFVLEHAGRARAGCWFNFNGTAGAWRKDAIDAAGGWRSTTLVEDLDLSYRAQLAGLRLVYLQEVVVPAELPRDVLGFRAQQHRWARGGAQVARRLLPAVLGARAPLRVRAEAVAHLTGNLGYLGTLGLALTSPVLPWLAPTPTGAWGAVQGALGLAALLPLVVAYAWAVVVAGSGATVRRLVELPVVLALGAGMCLAQSRAVVLGLLDVPAAFDRTPKEGEAGVARYAARSRGSGAGELLLAAWQGVGLVGVTATGRPLALGLLVVLGTGLTLLGLSTLRATGRRSRVPTDRQG